MGYGVYVLGAGGAGGRSATVGSAYAVSDVAVIGPPAADVVDVYAD